MTLKHERSKKVVYICAKSEGTCTAERTHQDTTDDVVVVENDSWEDSGSIGQEKVPVYGEMGFPITVLDGPNVDKGWAWMALLASFLAMVTVGLCMPMAGIIYIYHLETFGENPALVACIGSLLVGLMSMCGPLAGWVCTRFGRRTSIIIGGMMVSSSLAVSSQSYNFWLVFVTNGIIAGIGLRLVTTPTHINIGCYFVRKRTLASALCMTGFPVGVFVAPPVLQYLESVYGWRGTLLLFAGFQLNLCVFGALMKPSPLEKHKNTRKNEKKYVVQKQHLQVTVNQQSVFRNVPFYFLSLTFFFANFAINALYVHLPHYVLGKGGSNTDLNSLYLILGVSGVFSKLLIGLGTATIKQGQSLDKISILFGSCNIVSCSFLIFPYLSCSQFYRSLCLFFVGFYYNVAPSMYVPICIEVAGFDNLNNSLGIIYFAIGSGYFSGPPITAWLSSIVKNQDAIFYCSGSVNLMAVMSLVLMQLFKRRDTVAESNKQ